MAFFEWDSVSVASFVHYYDITTLNLAPHYLLIILAFNMTLNSNQFFSKPYSSHNHVSSVIFRRIPK